MAGDGERHADDHHHGGEPGADSLTADALTLEFSVAELIALRDALKNMHMTYDAGGRLVSGAYDKIDRALADLADELRQAGYWYPV